MTSGLKTRVPEAANAPFDVKVTAGAGPLFDVAEAIASPTRIDAPPRSDEEFRRFLERQLREHDATRDRAINLRIVLARLEGISFETAAVLLGTSPKKLTRWLHGADTVPARKADLIRDLNRIVLELSRILDPAALPLWLETANPKLGGQTPLEALRRHRVTEVLKVVKSYLEPTFG
jgi:hypothetical protein